MGVGNMFKGNVQFEKEEGNRWDEMAYSWHKELHVSAPNYLSS